jgi:hypothetical protein
LSGDSPGGASVAGRFIDGGVAGSSGGGGDNDATLTLGPLGRDAVFKVAGSPGSLGSILQVCAPN